MSIGVNSICTNFRDEIRDEMFGQTLAMELFTRKKVSYTKGASIYDVRKVFGFFDPFPTLSYTEIS